jgi:hypothetical protein
MVKAVNNYCAYRADCRQKLYALIPFYFGPLSSKHKVTSKSRTGMIPCGKGRTCSSFTIINTSDAKCNYWSQEIVSRKGFSFLLLACLNAEFKECTVAQLVSDPHFCH